MFSHTGSCWFGSFGRMQSNTSTAATADFTGCVSTHDDLLYRLLRVLNALRDFYGGIAERLTRSSHKSAGLRPRLH